MSGRGAEFIAIGSELLEPLRLDTNGSYVARKLGEIGIAIRFRSVVGDRIEDLSEVFRTAIGRCDLVVATGGLGPTIDDLTREAVAAVLGLPLEEDAAIVASLRRRFASQGFAMPPSNLRQAQVIRGAEVIPNSLGSAPGQLLRSGDVTLVLLPGVPDEMKRMFEEWLLPRLQAADERHVYRVVHIAGLTESEVDRRLAGVAATAGDVGWTILASLGQVDIHLRETVRAGEPPLGIERLDRAIVEVLGLHVVSRGEAGLEDEVGRLLLQRGETVAVAESVTGGLVSRRLTDVPGASRYFLGTAVCYSESAKELWAGVSRATLDAAGAVSEVTVREMASGVRERLNASWGLAITGFAGPAAGEGQPPGVVFIGLCDADGCMARRLQVPGNRSAVRARAAQAALDMLRRGLIRGRAREIDG